ncbi:MAG TPA: PEGA domain-containing protein [Longimicrobium sp.]|nr:PEGA domain-containing protein [Longimicrobium sp.]
MVRTCLWAALAALALCACIPAYVPHGTTLVVRTDSVRATVRDARGRPLGTTPLRVQLRGGRHQLVVSAPGYDTVVIATHRSARPVQLAALSPYALLVTGAEGTVWAGEARAVEVALRPAARLSGAEVAAVLTAFAAAAEGAGCDTLLVGAWRDAAIELGGGTAAVVPDSIRRFAAEEAGRAAPEMRSLCAARTPLLERLRQIGRAVRPGAPPEPEADEAALAPVYFELGRWEVRDDSVRRRLQAAGRSLAASGLPVRLVVEGFTDPRGSEALNRELGYSRANAVIRELQRGGLPRDCCVAVSHPGAAAGRTFAADTPDARLARRVTFSLDYREEAP